MPKKLWDSEKCYFKNGIEWYDRGCNGVGWSEKLSLNGEEFCSEMQMPKRS